MSFLYLSRLLNFEIAFITIEEGKIPMERIINIISADTYSAPIIESMYLGATISTAISGEIKLKPILKLPEDKSTFDIDEIGITMNEILEAKLAVTTLIMNAT